MKTLFIWCLIVIVPSVAIFIWGSKKAKTFNKQLAQYAAARNWTAGAKAPLISAFQRQGYKSEKSLASGLMHNRKFWLYNCVPPIIQGFDNRDPILMLTVVYQITFPTLMVVSARGVIGEAYDSYAKTLGLQPFQLEGDFSQHVRTYTELGQQVETLRYLTPDVMEAVEGNIHSLILFSDQYLSFCTEPVNEISFVDTLVHDAELVISALRQNVNDTLPNT